MNLLGATDRLETRERDRNPKGGDLDTLTACPGLRLLEPGAVGARHST